MKMSLLYRPNCGLGAEVWADDKLEIKYGLFDAPLLISSSGCRSMLMSDSTEILKGVEKGEPKAAEQLLELVYEELRRLAASKLAAIAPGQTLQPTALVHEVWLRLVGDRERTFKNRAHFFSPAAEAMRHILIDLAR